MRILFVADGRSPIARSWIAGVVEAGHEVCLGTTYRCKPIEGIGSMTHVPVAFSGLSRGAAGSGSSARVNMRAWVRQWFGPLTVPFGAGRVRTLANRHEPDLVHALRVPFEGMLAAWATPPAPLVVSSWGNDFTLHGPSSPGMRWLTRRTMAAAAGLHADCQRDLRLAREWGFESGKPTIVVPGNGGLDPVFFEDPPPDRESSGELGPLLGPLDEGRPVVVNPRGFRSYVRNDTFFRSIPAILRRQPGTLIVCPMMAGDRIAESWVEQLGVGPSVHLLGRLCPAEMASLLRRAQVVVSPSEHDGTPNSLLEAMACGAVPVAGDLESVREWIEDGRNGYLVDPVDPQALAGAVVAVLTDDAWRRKAAKANRSLVRKRADRGVVMTAAQAFYEQVLRAAAGG